MIRFRIPTATVLLATFLVSCANNTAPAEQDVPAAAMTEQTELLAKEASDNLPSFQMVNAAGENVSLEAFRGKKVFVNLWASWCPPCKREMPSIKKLAAATDTSKVAFVLLSLDDQFEKAIRYGRSAKLGLPLYYPAQNLPALFNVESIPTTFIFNEKGKLVQRIDGSDDYDTDAYRKLLK